MPYKIEKRGDKYCVVRRDTGENKGCSDTKQEAQAHMNAMHAAEHGKSLEGIDLKAWDGRFVSQQEANYTTLSESPGQACANCRWFSADYDRCFIVENFPQPILATGHSNRWEASPVVVIPEVEPIPVVIVEPPMEMDDSAEMALSVPKSIFQRVKEFAATLRPRATPEPQAFTVFKTATGKNAWIARHTGKWIDRENEILSEKSHEDYVERVQKGITPKPELWMWHAKGTRHGEAIAVWKAGGFVCAAGLFDETPAGEKAFQYYQKHSGKIKLSHMFHYPRETKIDGVYHAYNTIEITTLPNGAEAFPYTSFEEIQTMALPKEAENMIAEALGADVLERARELDGKALDDTKTLDALGVASKGYDKYDGAGLVPAEKVAALETAQAAIDARLKELGDVPATIKALNDSVKALNDQLQTELQAKADLLAKINELESKQALLTDLKPPASQSSETLLNDRDKSFIDTVMAEAKNSDQPSLIEKLLGVQPTIHS
jgi:hypothetical protein